MAITSGDADRIWVIVTLVTHLLSLPAEGPLSLTPRAGTSGLSTGSSLCPDALCLTFPHLQLINFYSSFRVPWECHFLLETFPGQLSPLPSRIVHALSGPSEHLLARPPAALWVLLGVLVCLPPDELLKAGTDLTTSVSLRTEQHRRPG